MTREERLEFCTNCVKRQFNPQKGLVCSLTGEHADFEFDCEDYVEDTEMLRDQQLRKELREAQSKSNDFFNLKKYGIKSELLGGILFLAGGLIWLVGGWINGIIFFYPFYLIIIGVILIIVGAVKNVKKMKKNAALKNVDEDIIDN